MKRRDLRNIHTTHAQDCTKAIPVFLPADGEASVSLLSNSTAEQNTYSCILKVTGLVWEYQKKDKHQH